MTQPKTLFKVLLILFVFVSCDNEPFEGEILSEEIVDDDDDDGDDDTNNDPDAQALLVSRIVEQIEGDSETFTTDYTYDSNNRLISEEDSDGEVLTYTYQNDQLIGTLSSNGNSVEDIIETYAYDSQGRVASITIDVVSINSPYTINLSYNSDNSIIEGFDSVTDELEERITLSNGNVVKVEEFDGSEIVTSSIITHDDMNGPFKNIDLKDTIITICSENLPNSFLNFDLNNLLTEEFTEDGNLVESYTYSYTYNDEGYPISSTEVFDDETDTEIINYTLTYISAQ